ncbi:hypothetical protein NDU88_001295 [Pleurodeles waltl]|uniref:Uncharacterized protein n=1 Tax=Pleurodeles waltl TaxID=8319 RepID=A0AAV7NDT5_PLEWA|nr:hypothetical protein NDU88_001295 [Pleurodeles waltl]
MAGSFSFLLSIVQLSNPIDPGWDTLSLGALFVPETEPEARARKAVSGYALGAAPGAFLSAASGRGKVQDYMEGRASPLAAFRVRVLALRSGVQNRGGRGHKAAPSLRVRHLAQDLEVNY